MMTLKLKVEAHEPQDSQRGRRRPPINDAAPLSFHTKMDGLRKREESS